MNREVLKAIDTNVIPISRLAALFDTFGLRHSSKVLPELLEAAEQGNASYKQLLLSIFETEVKGRNARRRKRNYAAAHFPPNIQPLEMFNPLELESGITQAQLNRLKELNWLDNKGNLVFAGPPGLGKTMVACGLGLEAINCGYTTFVSDTYETSSLIFTTNKEIADWAEMMGDPVLTTALLDRILQHASCFSFTGESYRLKHPHTFPAPLPEKEDGAKPKGRKK